MKQKLKITFIFLLIAASLGLSLRMIQAGIIPGHFKHLMHGHSHIALLGWLYNGVLILLQYLVFDRQSQGLTRVFWLSQITFAGMLFSFPFQGYAFWSITFSTLYLFLSYYLVYVLLRESKHMKNKTSKQFVRWGGVYLVLSSIGPFSLGFIMAKGLQDTFWYKLSIYWFLHFLYNGFLMMAVFAYFAKRLPGLRISNTIFWQMNLSVVPLYFLSVLWLHPHWGVYVLALFGATLQFSAFKLLVQHPGFFALFSTRILHRVFFLTLVVYALKMIFQVTSVLPSIQLFLSETTAFSVIGFIHLVMLGFFTLLFVAIFIHHGFLVVKPMVKWGLGLLVLGIVLSEIVLFAQSIGVYTLWFSIPNYYHVLMYASAFMPLGIVLLVLGYFTTKTT